MDSHIIEWQAMWKEQKSDTIESSKLIKRLNKIEQRAKFKRIILLLLFSTLFLTSLVKLPELLSNTYYAIAYLMIFSAVLIKLIPLYKTKYKILSDESDLSNHSFIKKLKQKNNYTVKHLLTWMSILIVALNIILLGLYEKGTIFDYEINDENRIFFHLATIILFLIGFLHNKRDIDKTKRKITSLINDLEE